MREHHSPARYLSMVTVVGNWSFIIRKGKGRGGKGSVTWVTVTGLTDAVEIEVADFEIEQMGMGKK